MFAMGTLTQSKVFSDSEYDVCELLSPSCICRKANERGVIGGHSLNSVNHDPVSKNTYDVRRACDSVSLSTMLARRQTKLLVVF